MTSPIPCAPQRANPTPAYLRTLVIRAGYTIGETALLAGVSKGTLERYLHPQAPARGWIAPYPLQFTLEALAASPRTDPPNRRRRRRPNGEHTP